jgi:hypothetical protein
MPVAILCDEGSRLRKARPDAPCPTCACPLNGHPGITPEPATTPMATEAGWLECPSRDSFCGVWITTHNVWV